MRRHWRDIGLLALVAALPLTAWLAFFRPDQTRNAKTIEMIEARHARLNATAQVVRNIDALKEETARLSQAVRSFDDRLTTPGSVDVVLREVSQLAQACHVTTKDVRTLEVRQEGKDSIQPISVYLEGSFSGIHTFLRSLEKQQRVVRVRGLSLSAAPEDAGGTVQATLALAVYLQGARI